MMPSKKRKHVESQFSAKVMSRLAADGETFGSFHDVFAHFRSYDPSRSGAYTTWLIKTYCEGGFLFEDLGKAKETLQWFDEFKRRLPVERRNIADYPTLADVWKVVKPFVETPEEIEPSKREQRRKEQEEVYTETIFLEETDDFRAVIPLTERASKWWGRGTRWCTAAEEDNKFIDYFKWDPLIVFDFKDGHKWQMWAHRYDFQFMDEDDQKVSFEKLETRWDSFESIMIEATKICPAAMNYVPPDQITFDFIYKILKKNGFVLGHIIDTFEYCNGFKSSEFRKIFNDHLDEFCLLAVQSNGTAIRQVPKDRCTLELCHVAIDQDPKSLEYLPLAFKTEELCKSAVEKDASMLKHVPEEMKTREMCSKAVKSNGFVLQYVPKEFVDYDMCLEAVRKKGWSIQDVPTDFRDEHVCRAAIRNDGLALDYVPMQLRSRDLCLEAIANSRDTNIMDKIPPEILTDDFHAEAIERNPLFFMYVPMKFVTSTACSKAMKLRGYHIKRVPSELLSEEICLSAVKTYGWALTQIPKEMRTEEICLEAINISFNILNHVPKELKTKEFMEKFAEKIKFEFFNSIKEDNFDLLAPAISAWESNLPKLLDGRQ